MREIDRTPLVSIACSVYNGARHIEEAIASICLQRYDHWELLLIDDGSDDDTVDRISRFDDPRIHLRVDGQRRGLPARLNQAVAAARGTLIARMDADDLSYPERLVRQVEYLVEHPDIDVVATNMLVMDADGRPRGTERWRGAAHADIVRTPWSGFHFNHATWLGHADWFRRFPYREDAHRSEDDDLMLRAFRHSRFARLEEILYAYRVDGLSIGSVLTARRSFVRSLWREARQQREPRLLRGVPIQWAKMGYDVAAIGFRADRWMHRHRADGAVSAAEAVRLRRVVNAAQGMSGD